MAQNRDSLSLCCPISIERTLLAQELAATGPFQAKSQVPFTVDCAAADAS